MIAQLTNDAPQQPITTRTAPSLHTLWRASLGSPIVASPLTFGGIVYAATESGTVVALLAATGATIWSDAFGSVTTATCGSWGVSSTGAIDTARGVLYVANADGRLRALDLVTGAVVWSAVISNRPLEEYVWGGLRLVGSQLYVPVASYCDAPGADGRIADGRVVGVDVQAHVLDATYDTVPGADNLGGIWGWGGVSVEADGSALWTATGNSHVLDAACNCFVDDAGDGNSVVKLSLGLQVLATDRPEGIPTTEDDDFGAAPVLFDVRGCGSYAAANNKDGFLYIWDRDDIAAGPLFKLGIGTASYDPFVGEPSWSADRQTLYDATTNVVTDGPERGRRRQRARVHADLPGEGLGGRPRSATARSRRRSFSATSSSRPAGRAASARSTQRPETCSGTRTPLPHARAADRRRRAHLRRTYDGVLDAFGTG